MTHLKIVPALKMTSGIPEDSSVNTFHVDCDLGSYDPNDFVPIFKGFYDTFYGRLANTVAQNGHSLKIYDMTDPEPRAPIVDALWNLAGAPGGTPMPSEVALCLSFQAARESGLPQARRRGRVYLGPFGTAANNNGRPSTDCINDVAAAGQYLLDASLLATEWTWAVYSQVDNALVFVINGWVDNAWDTQRRRGVTPTARTTFE